MIQSSHFKLEEGIFNKVIFIVEMFFCKYDYDRFGVDILKKNKINVEIWDLTHIASPHISYDILPLTQRVDQNIIRFKCKFEFYDHLKKLKESSFVVFFGDYVTRNYKLFKTLKNKNITYALFEANHIPLGNPNLIKKQNYSIIKKIKKLPFRRGVEFIFRRIPFKLIGTKPANYTLVGGECSYGHIKPQNNLTKKIWIHSLDYDNYLRAKKSTELKCLSKIKENRKLAIFLDECLPCHPEYDYLKESSPVTIKDYSYSLSKFFDFIEKNYDYKVVVASHPRSEYEKYPGVFGGREIIRGDTASLIKSSDLVIAHSSTSIGFAVLDMKPIVFITNNNIINTTPNDNIKLVSNLFNKKPINIDLIENKKFSLESSLNIDCNLYSKYINDFIKRKGSEDILFWEAFSKLLQGELLLQPR